MDGTPAETRRQTETAPWDPRLPTDANAGRGHPEDQLVSSSWSRPDAVPPGGTMKMTTKAPGSTG